MLSYIELEGFKCFDDEVLDFGNLTVLTGLNSSGKSSVIQAVRMVHRMCNKHNALLPCYGNYKELTNRDFADSLRIAIYDDKDNKFVVEEHVGAVDNLHEFPTLLYASASRFGPQVSIPVYANDTEPDELGQNLVKSILEYGDHLMNPLLVREDAEGRTFEFVLKAWMKLISPSTKLSFIIDEKADMSYITFNGHRAKNVGFGLSFTLPVITNLLLGTIIPNSLVIIENPEAHLHARAQTEMAFLIANCVKAGAQVIVETHSDHLFDGLRIFTKENPGFQEMMKCYWFELDEDGCCDPKDIELGKNGRIISEDIPSGFSDQFEFNARRLLGLI